PDPPRLTRKSGISALQKKSTLLGSTSTRRTTSSRGRPSLSDASTRPARIQEKSCNPLSPTSPWGSSSFTTTRAAPSFLQPTISSSPALLAALGSSWESPYTITSSSPRLASSASRRRGFCKQHEAVGPTDRLFFIRGGALVHR